MSDFTRISNILTENTKYYLQTYPGLYKTRIIDGKEFSTTTFKFIRLSLMQLRIAFTLNRYHRLVDKQICILDNLNDDAEVYDFREELKDL